MTLRLLDLCACEGGATAGYQRAGWHVTAVDQDAAALARNPADLTVKADALSFLADHWREFDAYHLSAPCQRWCANGANPAADDYPDLITPGRELLEATGRPWVMENVLRAPLRRDLILCGSMFNLTSVDTDGTLLHLKRHRVFEANFPLVAPHPCSHPRGAQWGRRLRRRTQGQGRSPHHPQRRLRAS